MYSAHCLDTSVLPQSPSLGELAQVILEDIENSTHVKPSRTSTAAPVSEGLHNRVVTSEGLTVVPVDLPDGLSGDTFQERLVAAGENVAGELRLGVCMFLSSSMWCSLTHLQAAGSAY